MNLQEAIEKAKKLQNLANNKGASVAEVKAATFAMNQIMQKYRIDQATLEAADISKAEPFVKKIVYQAGNLSSWRETILSALCKHYGAAYFRSQYRSAEAKNRSGRVSEYIVCARKGDADIIDYMFGYLRAEGERLASFNNIGYGPGWSKSYLEGFGQGVATQFSELQQAAKALLASSQSTALVLLDRRVSESRAWMNSQVSLRTGRALGGAHSHSSAKSEGYVAGKNVRVNPGMGGSSGPSRGRLGT